MKTMPKVKDEDAKTIADMLEDRTPDFFNLERSGLRPEDLVQILVTMWLARTAYDVNGWRL